MNQTCETVRGQFAMLVYGELSFDEEDSVETHLAECADCRAALERERELLAVFDQVAVEPSPALLAHCREDLAARLLQEPRPEGMRSPGWFERLLEMFTIRIPMNWAQPAGALALVALGFFGSKVIPTGSGLGETDMSVMPGAARVRYVEPSANGQVQIVLDETRQRVITGSMEDANVRRLVLDAVRDSDQSLRQQTVAFLTDRAVARDGRSGQDVRDALLWAMRNDENDGVRTAALEGLKGYSQDDEIRGALAQVLLTDRNAGMRTKAIDLLMQGMNDSTQTMDRQMIGVFQELMSRQDENAYIRERAQRTLELVNASAEIY